jgi:hypothetical protein
MRTAAVNRRCAGSVERSRNRLEIKARIDMLACGCEILDAGIRHEEIGRLLQPVGDRAV